MTPAQHGILVISVLFLVMTLLFLAACLLACAVQAAERRRQVRPHFEQVELARRAVARVEADRRRPAVVSTPVLPRPAATPTSKRRVA